MLDRRTLLQWMTAAIATSRAPLTASPFGWSTYPPPDRELMVPVPGGRVYVRINGAISEQRLPIVFIHGGPGGNHGSVLNGLAISDERAVILYDQLDSGLSDRPNDPANRTLPRFVMELETVLVAIGIRRCHVFGQSWGGTIALEYAAKQPRALSGLVLASPLISTKIWLADAVRRRKRLPKQVQATLRGCDPPAIFTRKCEIAMQSFNSAFVQREPDPAPYRQYYRQSGMRVNDDIYKAMWGASEFVSTGTLKHYDGERLLSRLNGAKTLFMVAQHDEVNNATAVDFADRIGAELTVVPGAGHLFLMDRPSEAIGVLRPWLREKES